MFEFFDQVLSFITSAWQMLVNFCNTLIVLLESVSLAVTLPLQLVAYMPMFVGSMVATATALWVAKLILGR